MITKLEEKKTEEKIGVASTVVDKSLAAEAASAHSRINVPLNVGNWQHLPEDVALELTWFHQYLLDKNLSWTEAQHALGYDRSTIFRVLKGTYSGSWGKIVEAIKSFRRLEEQRGSIQKNEFVANSISKLIWAGLDYAMANNSITMIIGESRMGKTISGKAWRDANNHGRSVYIEVPPYGSTKALLRVIAEAVGVNKNLGSVALLESILRSFNRNRILIVDEAHRLLPNDRRVNPVSLEILRHIHDKTGAAVALFATQRFDDSLKSSQYQFEQILGRIGMPIRLPRKINLKDILPIIHQFVKNTSPALEEQLLDVANKGGRLGILVETLKVASRMANKKKEKLAEHHIFSALALRHQMQGGNILQSKQEEGK